MSELNKLPDPNPTGYVPLEFWCWIRAKDHNTQKVYGVMEWRGMTFEQFNKWQWYFRYRWALLQTQYPKLQAEFHSGSCTPTTKTYLNILKNRIKGKKGKITEIQNKLNRAIREWDEIFPIESDPLWPKACEKLSRLKNELLYLENEFQTASQMPKKSPEGTGVIYE